MTFPVRNITINFTILHEKYTTIRKVWFIMQDIMLCALKYENRSEIPYNVVMVIYKHVGMR